MTVCSRPCHPRALALAAALLGQPVAARAQGAWDALFVIPADSLTVTCGMRAGFHEDAGLTFQFGIGMSQVLLRSPSGQVTPLSPPPRNIIAAFTAAGRPQVLGESISTGSWSGISAVIEFDSTGRGEGFRSRFEVDSAAIVSIGLQHGPLAGIAALRLAAENAPQTPIDSAGLARGRALADYLWGKRCG